MQQPFGMRHPLKTSQSMLNPIKRVWVPRALVAQVLPAQPAPAAPPSVFDPLLHTLPVPQSVEKNSDSIWAAFESVHHPEIERP